MVPAKVKILVSLYAYSGNGGIAGTIPEIAIYLAKIWHQMKTDPRVSACYVKVYCDTPITMTRNQAVRDAKELGCDMLLMLDSDNEPDAYVGSDPNAKPFFDVGFSFAYERLVQGIPTVIAAPYCGPPPHPVGKPGVKDGGEVPYLFAWTSNESDGGDAKMENSILTRLEAARLQGIHPMSALPTGVCLFTLNAFEGMPFPYFKYEWNEDHSQKLSTEDVVATRDISLFWKITKDIDVIFAACDSWALHHKVKKVGKPKMVMLESVAKEFRDAIYEQRSGLVGNNIVDYTASLPRLGQVLSHDQDHIVISDEELKQFAELEKAEGGQVQKELFPDKGYEEPKSFTFTIPENLPDPPKMNGKPKREPAVLWSIVGGKKLAFMDGTLPAANDMEALLSMGAWVAKRKDSQIEAAVIHGGVGIATAALNEVLPEGSHIYCLDSLGVQANGAKQFGFFETAFKTEIISGRVMADIDGRDIGDPEANQHLDLVFIERFATHELLERWLRHLAPLGILAGLGGIHTATGFAEKHSLPLRTEGNLWVIVTGARHERVQESSQDSH